MPQKPAKKSAAKRKVSNVTVGNTTVRIYASAYKSKGHNYEQFTLSYREGGKRIRRTFHDHPTARREAERIADRLEQGHRDSLKLTNADAELFVLAKREADKSGVPLLEAIRQFAAAMKSLPEGSSLVEAVKDYARRHPTNVASKLLPDVVDEFIAAKTQDGASEAYLRTLRFHLNPLKARFKTDIKNVLASDLDAWLREAKHSARTRRNISTSIVTLFRFARGLGFLPKGVATEAEGITKPKIKGGAIGIITPEQFAQLLAEADTDEKIIYFTIGGFAGLRSAEISRLSWKEIDLKGGNITVAAANAKTASRRLVPICDALRAWLLPCPARTGPVFSSARVAEYMTAWAGAKLGEWPPNALRHSFVSYRVAETQDVAKVALEAGNSPQMIFANYRELVTREAAAAWFAIMPPSTPANLIKMKGAA
jgi:integrase